MKLFVLLSRVPYPLEKGDKLRAYEQLKILNQEYQIHLCCLHSKSSVSKEIAIELNKICDSYSIIKLTWLRRIVSMILGVFKRKPIQVSYFFQKSAYKKVQQEIAKFGPEHIYCQLIRTSEYVKANFEVTKTLDYMDALSTGMIRRLKNSNWITKPIYNFEYKRLRSYEEEIFDFFEYSAIISSPDQLNINHAKKEQILLVPNGVNENNFVNYTEVNKTFDLVFTGNMQYAPNVDAAIFLAESILPIVWESHPNTSLLISGATPTKKVLGLQSPKIKVTGWVDDILHSYASAKVFIAPMRLGSGLQNKLLEAMSMKIPCITTSIANDSLKATHNNNILVGNSTNEIATHITNLLSDKNLADQLAENGHQFVKNNFNWKASTNVLNQAFRAKIK
jgi:glycosyltransferase involved in cell wall biosynthesis